MKLPKGFVPDKEQKEKVEKLVNKTLVEKILVEKLAEEIGEHIENIEIAKKIKLEFNKLINIQENKEAETEKKIHESNSSHETKIVCTNKDYFLNKEKADLMEKIIEELGLKEDEIIDYSAHPETRIYRQNFDILTKNIICKFSFDTTTFNSIKDLDKTYTKTVTINKRFLGKRRIVRKLAMRETIENFQIIGELNYTKFNLDYNKNIIKLLKENDYEVKLSYTKPKK